MPPACDGHPLSIACEQEWLKGADRRAMQVLSWQASGGWDLWRRLTAMLPFRAFDLTLIKANISGALGYFGCVSQCQTKGVA